MRHHDGHRHHARHHPHFRWSRRLKTRLFMWFFGAIVLAITSSAAVVHFTKPEQSEGPVRVMSRTIAGRLSKDWDDPRACDAYLGHIHDTLGLDLRIVRDPSVFPSHARKGGRGAPLVTFTRDGKGLIPISRGGVVVGGVEFDSSLAPPQPARVALALAVAVFVLAMAAVRVSRSLARPLERVANAAERFGDGDLAARVELGPGRRWVAGEVAEVATAFDRMAQRIQRVVQDQRELLAAISHELRSPLGRARVALEIAREAKEPAHALSDVERQLGEVDAILGDLQASARAGLSDLRVEETELLPWLRARAAAEPSPPVIEIVAADDADVKVKIDRPLLARALHNMVTNAKSHGHPESLPLELRVDVAEPGRVRIVLRDRGPGFPDGLLDRAFEPFVRGDAARSPGGGTGLGLTLVQRIVEAHGGRAFVQNLPGTTRTPSGEDLGRPSEPGRVGAEVGFELPFSP